MEPRMLAVLAMVIALGAPATSAQNILVNSTSRAPVRLMGVYDEETGKPIEGAEVWDRLANVYVKTSPTGTVSLNFLRSQHDSSVVYIRKIGYGDTTFLVMTDTTPITLTLTRTVPRLAPVETHAIRRRSMAMQGFEDRRNSGAVRGYFVAPEELRSKWDGQLMRSVFASHGMIPMSRGPTSLKKTSCRTLYYVNGIPGTPLAPVEKDPADAYEAVEFYPSKYAAPQEFVGAFSGDVCGIFVLWSRGA
ncbi:hypothetical protein KW785_00825 [Candidatus Parcubacteria bacterium]|nr:hypothetical protein [Candidatus Parcubacteria bacterium]